MAKVCIIPARGGSKRIPRKNIRLFSGRPALSWSIAAALDSTLFDRVIVSTEDAEIAEIARRQGAEVPFLRNPETADDTTGLIEVLAEVLGRLEAQGEEIKVVCCLLATAVLVTPKRLTEAHELFAGGDWESVYPVVAYASPIQRALVRDDLGATRMLEPAAYTLRSQDLEPRYHDAGQFYWLQTSLVRRRGSILACRSASVVVDEMDAQDIDTESDWRLAELKHQLRTAPKCE